MMLIIYTERQDECLSLIRETLSRFDVYPHGRDENFIEVEVKRTDHGDVVNLLVIKSVANALVQRELITDTSCIYFGV